MKVKKTSIMKLQFSSLLSFFLFGILFFVISGCSSTNAVEEEIAKIPVDITLDRFDQKFFNASKEDFYQLKQDYPYLFPEQYPDSIWQKASTRQFAGTFTRRDQQGLSVFSSF